MSLFDLQDVCIAIGSLATLDLPMVVDLIGIFGLKGPYLTLAMSLFDLQDVCIAIGSLATLDLPMVVDLIGIFGLKGPYRTLTTTKWFLQALSVIPRGSWGDVARRFTMIRWAVAPIEGGGFILTEGLVIELRPTGWRRWSLVVVGTNQPLKRWGNHCSYCH
ncbi:hypothetical protein F511_25805 [Dorcoceras hygrometricum]|uniref:Uncharacterized protein n=1 Tax=Dorcoceras hygrometricum TaxID=472368 RepID=A0A2Z7BXF0_9LAMI|nr:hypothetical protein F511_25805 [Dorcoceras hygrometricum]